jgi:hypothetical protein
MADVLMFAIFNIIVYSWFLIKETSGKSLEEMEVVFGTVDRLPTTGKEVGEEEGRHFDSVDERTK